MTNVVITVRLDPDQIPSDKVYEELTLYLHDGVYNSVNHFFRHYSRRTWDFEVESEVVKEDADGDEG